MISSEKRYTLFRIMLWRRAIVAAHRRTIRGRYPPFSIAGEADTMAY
jgi:hypothetical protein